MRRIYHLVLRASWEKDTPSSYRPISLETEGFIHCSNADQVAGAANRFYANAADLLVLHIDPALLTSPLRDEAASNGELFPHIYGPIGPTAIVAIEILRRGPDGAWVFRT
jgi:glutathione S-transferase